MRKKITILGTLCLSIFGLAQVGINTETPKATLDVAAKNATGTGTTTDGLLVPRVDRQRAQSMTGVETSTLVYITSIATGTATGTTVDVRTTGFYEFNGTKWVMLRPKFAGFSATKNTNFTVGAGDVAQFVFTGEEFDTHDWFSLSTSRFNPKIAGYYQINLQMRIWDGGSVGERNIQLFKNGSMIRTGIGVTNGTMVVHSLNSVVYLNGTTDYLDARIYTSTTMTSTSNPAQSSFQGYLLGE